MEISEILQVIIALASPLVASFFKNPKWSQEMKLFCVLMVSILLAVLSQYIAGDLHLDGDLANAAFVIFSIATILYKAFLKDTTLNKDLEAKKVL